MAFRQMAQNNTVRWKNSRIYNQETRSDPATVWMSLSRTSPSWTSLSWTSPSRTALTPREPTVPREKQALLGHRVPHGMGLSGILGARCSSTGALAELLTVAPRAGLEPALVSSRFLLGLFHGSFPCLWFLTAPLFPGCRGSGMIFGVEGVTLVSQGVTMC